MLLILSENWTLTSGRELRDLVRWARIAEDTGFDAVMLSEHVVLGPDASADGVMANPREYALPGNQDPATPWPNSLLLLASIAAVTRRIRLVAGAVIAPLRHPLLLARELGTLDLLAGGRLVVQPTVSWSADEYRALGVPFERRGAILDEQLEILDLVWRGSPVSYAGRHFRFTDIHLEPMAYRAGGPRMWFGGATLHPPLTRRLVRYGHGWHPLGQPAAEDRVALATAMAAAGRSMTELELVGGTRARFPDDRSVADLGEAMAALPEQLSHGFTTFCVKPSQFIDDPAELESLCRDVMRRADRLA